MKYFSFLIAVSGVLTCSELLSTELPAIEFDTELVAIASGRPVPVSSSPSVSKVITRADFQDHGYQSISEALHKTAGINSMVQGFSVFPIYSVRGFTSFYNALFLVNGDPFDSSFYGALSAGLSRIPIEMVDRIEIMLNPGGAIYGGNSTMGVVNIIMEESAIETLAAVTYGSFNTTKIKLAGGVKKWGANINAGIDMVKTDGNELKIDRDTQSLIDDQTGFPISLAPTTVNLNDNLTGATLTASRNGHKLFTRLEFAEDIDTGVGLVPVVDKDGNMDGNKKTIVYNFPLNNIGLMDFKGSVSYKSRDFNFNDIHTWPPGAFGMFPNGVISSSTNSEQYYSAGVIGLLNTDAGHSVRIEGRAVLSKFEIKSFSSNFELEEGNYTPTEYGAKNEVLETESRSTYSLRLNDDWDINSKYSLAAGVGLDKYKNFGTEISPRLGLIWRKTYNTSVKILFNQASRIPSYFETTGFGIPLFLTSKSLVPERTKSYDISLDHRISNRFKISGNVFYHKTNRLLASVQSDVGLITTKNIAVQTGKGFEVEGNYELASSSNLRMYAQLQENRINYDHIVDRTSAGIAPSTKIGVQYTTMLRGVRYGFTYLHVGAPKRGLRDSKAPLGSYDVIDIYASKKFNNSLSLDLKINNAADASATQPNFSETALFDIDLPGRNFLLSVKKELR